MGTPGGKQLTFGSFELIAVYGPMGRLALNFSSAQGVRGRVFKGWPCGSAQTKSKVFTDDGYQTPEKSAVWAGFWLVARVCASRTDEKMSSVIHPSETISGTFIWKSPVAISFRGVHGHPGRPAFSPASPSYRFWRDCL